MSSMNQRSTSTAWTQHVAGRCHRRASTRRRWACSHRETRATDSMGTSRVARYESMRGSCRKVSWSKPTAVVHVPQRNSCHLSGPGPRVPLATRQSHWHHRVFVTGRPSPVRKPHCTNQFSINVVTESTSSIFISPVFLFMMPLTATSRSQNVRLDNDSLSAPSIPSSPMLLV